MPALHCRRMPGIHPSPRIMEARQGACRKIPPSPPPLTAAQHRCAGYQGDHRAITRPRRLPRGSGQQTLSSTGERAEGMDGLQRRSAPDAPYGVPQRTGQTGTGTGRRTLCAKAFLETRPRGNLEKLRHSGGSQRPKGWSSRRRFSTDECLVVQRLQAVEKQRHWIPAFAGMTYSTGLFEVPKSIRVHGAPLAKIDPGTQP